MSITKLTMYHTSTESTHHISRPRCYTKRTLSRLSNSSLINPLNHSLHRTRSVNNRFDQHPHIHCCTINLWTQLLETCTDSQDITCMCFCVQMVQTMSLSIHHNHTAASIECQVHIQQHKDHITITYVHTGTALHCTSSFVSRLLQNANMCTLLHNFNVCIPEQASLGTRLLYSHTDMYLSV